MQCSGQGNFTNSRGLINSQLSFGLVGNSFLSGLELFLADEVVVLKGVHLGVELKDKRASGGDVVANDLLLVHASEVLDNSTERVAMSNDYNALTVHDLGADRVVPVGENAIDSDLQGLGTGKHNRWEELESTVKLRMSFVILIELRRGDIVRTTPLSDFLFSVLFSSLGLVKSLKGSVVTLIQSP